MKVLDLGADPEEAGGYNRYYYRLATVTWSRPKLWHPDETSFAVPNGWAGYGGIYAFMRQHWRQQGHAPIAYIGKANRFERRLTSQHNHFDLVRRRGDTLVSCGRIAFSRIRSRTAYYAEIEDIVKFAVWPNLENVQGFESLPGFRKSQPRVLVPWVIINEGFRFNRRMPKRVIYPAIAVD